jgi:autotransporter family porin
MNKLYRVIWNRAVGRFVVAPENATPRAGMGAARIATPLLIALCAPATAMAQSQIADGTQLIVAPGSYGTTADGESGLVARNGGNLQADGVSVSTSGNGATGVLANGLNATHSEVTISNSQVTTHGDNSAGMAAIDKDSRITATNVSITTEGTNSVGVVSGGAVGDGSSQPVVVVSGSTVTTSGDRGLGVVAQGDGRVYMSDSSVTTSGDEAMGVIVRAGSAATLQDTDISTSGAGANGVSVVKDPGELDHTTFDMTGGSITTSGDSSKGVVVNNGSFADLDGVSIDTSGLDSVGLVSTGTGANGVRSSLYLTDGSVKTSGDGATGVLAENGGIVSISGSSIITSGDNAAAVSVAGEGSKVVLTNSNVSAQGAGSAAAQVNGGTLNVSGGSLTSSLGNTIDVGGATPSTINLSNSTQISNGTGVFVQVNDENAALSLNLDQRVRAQGDINGVDSNGDGQISATTDMTLSNLSSWQGSTNGAVDQLSLSGGSEWTMTGDSTVGQVDLNNSTIAFAQPTNGDFKTLTVTGDFNSNGGVLLMNSELNGDDSPSDMLHVEGSTSGQAYVHVNNVGGVGDTTTDGIELIQVDGQSDAQFDLAGRAVGGSEEYFLYQGSYTDPNDGDWYLRSELPTDPTDPIVPPPVDPGEPGDPTDPIVPPPVDPGDPTDPIVPPPPTAPAVPVYRPEVGSYLSNQAAAVNMFQLSMHDRLGTPELDPQKLSDDRLGSLWVRVNRTDTDYTGGKGQLDVDSDTSVLQIGADLVHWGDYGRGIFGVMAGTGSNKNTTRSDLTGYSSKGEVDGTAVGVYGTWFANPTGETGLYVDSWLQYGRYDNSVQGEGLDEENYDSRTLAGSIEAGYSWNVFSNETTRVYVQPQLQVTATHYDSDDHQETNGTEIKSDEAGGVTTRSGVRVYSQINLDSGMKVQPYADVNWYHNSRDNAVAFNDSVMQGGDPKDRYEFKTGAQLVLGKHWSTWGQVGVQSGEDDYGNVSGQVGLKYNF